MKVKDLLRERTIRKVLLFLLLSVAGMTNVYAVTIGELTYSLYSSTLTATVTGHKDGTSATGSLTIPSSVTYTSYEWVNGEYVPVTRTYSVTAIADNAFKNCNGLTGSLTIPNSVTTIGQNAFRGCSGFTGSLTLPNSVTTIEKNTFYGCSGFTGSLTLPNSVMSIGNYAFYNCSSFTGSLTIPNSVTTIGECAFRYCSGFTGSLTIPNSLTEIGNWIFYNCSGFTGSLTIPNSVTSIGVGAFSFCSGFTGDLIIPNSVMTIKGGYTDSDGAFSYCSGFTGSLTIPNSVTTIGQNAFRGCSGFTGSLTLPNSVTTIEKNTFYGCSGFTGDLTIPNSVTTIRDQAFRNCSGFTSMYVLADLPPTTYSSYDAPFSGVNHSIPVYVPCASKEAYEEADVWRTFTNIKGMCPSVIFTIIIPANGGTVTGGNTYAFGDTVTLVASPNPGFTFINWTVDGQQVSMDTVYTFISMEDTNVEANFTDDPVYVDISATTDPIGGGIIEGDGTYIAGQTATLTTTANEGYIFLNWTKDGEVVSTENSISFLVAEDKQYVAHFNPIHQVEVTVLPVEGGTASGTGEYENGTACTLSALANTGYGFQCWTKENGPIVSTEPTFSFTVTESATYEARFVAAENVVIGTGTQTNSYLPSYSSYNYSFTQQIYTADELSGVGTVGSLSFFNEGSAKTRNYTIYMVHTDKALFSSNTDWIAVTAGDEVFSGSVTMTEGTWTTITLQTPFTYDGTSNVALIVDDNTGSYSSGMSCRVFDANGSQAIRIYSDGTNYDPNAPASYNGTRLYVKNCIMLGAGSGVEMQTYTVTVTASPATGGTVEGGGVYLANTTATLTAIPNEVGTFINWTKDGEEVSTELTYSFTVTEDASFVAHFETTDLTQTTHFNNGWNWWSSYIELSDNSLEALQNGLGTSGMMIKSQNNGYASYLDGYGWYGSLSTINNESTYQIRASEACTVEMTGSEANPTDHPITLNSGWTWVGYPVNAMMSVADALSGITPQNGDMLKSQNDGYASYLEGYGWYGSLNTLNPGMGLMFKSNNANTVTLVYPNSGTRTDLKANQTAESNYWQPNLNAYPDNMSVMAVVELDGIKLQGENYELATFANGEVRGSARLLYVEPLHRYIAFLTIAGEEAAELHFGLYNIETGMVETQCLASLQYETNAVVGSFAEPYVVSFRSMTGTDEGVNNLQIYPNPVGRGQTVSLDFDDAETGKVCVEIINALGMVVETYHGASPQTIVAPKVAGVYMLRITMEGRGTSYRKLVVKE